MISLNQKLAKKYAYQKSGVIFEISMKDTHDACVVPIDSGTTPYIIVKCKQYGDDGKRLYFDEYIKDGDLYKSDGSGLVNGKFKKVIHSTDVTADVEKTFQDYYSGLCENQIEESLLEYYTLPYSSFTANPDLLGIERFMLKNSGYTTEHITQIDFTESYYNKMKEHGIKEQILKVAQDEAEHFGYKLVKPDDSTDSSGNISGITITKITE